MIPFDFDYYKPSNVAEALGLYRILEDTDRQPLYYGGGTEIITMARASNIFTKAVIDLKGISECTTLEVSDGKLVIGAGVTLTQISESELFPLLAMASGRIADHTTQGKITIGGNVAGTIIYHEALLPLLLVDSEVIVASLEGKRRVPITDVFNKKLLLKKGEFILQFIVDKAFTTYPFVHVKRTKSDKIDYPVLSVAAVKTDESIRIAFSGVCAFPFRSEKVEGALNDHSLSTLRKIDQSIEFLPEAPLHDISGSASYREFVLRNTLGNILEYSWEAQNA
jgi:CO/xanthine dehydrogenase FAD-binding subunit